MGRIDDRLAELGYVLPEADVPPNKFVNIARSGNLLFTGACGLSMLLEWPAVLMLLGCVAGHISIAADGELIKGRLGRELTVEEGYAAAHRVALSLLATIKSELRRRCCLPWWTSD